MNLTEMRTMVRRDLRDTDAAVYRWTDEALDRHIAHALNDISYAIPQEKSVSLATAAGSCEMDLASLGNRIMLHSVEYPAGRYPPQYRRFEVWGDRLTLLDGVLPDGSPAGIRYGARQVLDEQESTLPSYLEDLLALGAEGYACLEWASYAINRVNSGGGLTPQAYADMGQARLDIFRRTLKRLGRNNRVRWAQLYHPPSGVEYSLPQ
jgi:hypothetical protein